MSRSPAPIPAAILTLAFGIAATSVLYSIFDGAYIHFAPTEQGNRNTLITQKFTKNGTQTTRFSAAEYFDIEDFRGPFEGFLALRHSGAALTDEAERGPDAEQVPIHGDGQHLFVERHISFDSPSIHGRRGAATWSECRGTHIPVMGPPVCTRSIYRWEDNQA